MVDILKLKQACNKQACFDFDCYCITALSMASACLQVGAVADIDILFEPTPIDPETVQDEKFSCIVTIPNLFTVIVLVLPVTGLTGFIGVAKPKHVVPTKAHKINSFFIMIIIIDVAPTL